MKTPLLEMKHIRKCFSSTGALNTVDMNVYPGEIRGLIGENSSGKSTIAAGADMILFNKSLDEDYHFLLEGLKTGKVTEARLDEAVKRILATKASLHLPEKQAEGKLVPGPEALAVVGCEKHKAWAKEVADKAVTLVRDEQQLLPISHKKFRRVYLNVIQKSNDPNDPLVQQWKALFEKEGFEVTVRDRRTTIVPADFMDPNLPMEKGMLLHEMYRSIEEMKQSYDLYVYICNMQNASNNTTLRLNWNVAFGLGSFFDAISDGNNITHSKPDPEVFVKAAQMLCMNPEDCLVVEDAVSGAIAGKPGGMLDEGADTFWELYNPRNPNESPYGGTIVNSYCHAWSCAPAYFLRKYCT